MNKPRTLESSYLLTKKLIEPFIVKYGNSQLLKKILVGGEKITKKPAQKNFKRIFDKGKNKKNRVIKNI